MSTSLQAKDLYTAEAMKISKKIVKTLKKVRCDEKFELFWKDVQNKAANLRIPLQSYRGKGEHHLELRNI